MKNWVGCEGIFDNECDALTLIIRRCK